MERFSKSCTKCGVEKEDIAYSRDASKNDGRRSRCKSCGSFSAARYYIANRSVILAKQVEYDRTPAGRGSRARAAAKRRELRTPCPACGRIG